MSRELCAAASASEAVIMRDDSSAYLAGGTELLRSGTERSADRLIMLKNIPDLKGVAGGTQQVVRIGSMTTFQEALGSELVPVYLKEALRYMASRTKRNMATIGGNVALMRDDSYLAATLIAAHAKLELLHFGSDALTRTDRIWKRLHRSEVISRYARPSASGAICSTGRNTRKT